MALSGDVGSMGLDEVVHFLATNGLDGVLTLCGAAASLRLILRGGQILAPDPRPGRLGPDVVDALLARARDVPRRTGATGRLGREALATLHARADAQRARPGSRPTPRPTTPGASRSGVPGEAGGPPKTGRVDRRALEALVARGDALRGEPAPAPPGALGAGPTPSRPTARLGPPPAGLATGPAPSRPVPRAGSPPSGPAPAATGAEPPRTGRLDRRTLEVLSARASEVSSPERRRIDLAARVHELISARGARFEFEALNLPAPVLAEIEAAGGLRLEADALLMEVARRGDERAAAGASARSRTDRLPRPQVDAAGGALAGEGERRAALEGDLDGVGLAALLQTLRARRRDGTLRVRAGRREERLFFEAGEAFVLLDDAPEAEAFAAEFLGQDGTESVASLALGLTVDERDLDQGRLRAVKDRFLDVLFWDDARFAFFRDELPREFRRPGPATTKVALQTDRFLLEAIQRMIEWDALRPVVRGGQGVLRFVSPEAKLAAIRGGAPEVRAVLTLVDGLHAFDDLVACAGVPRLEAARALAAEVERGRLVLVE